MAKIIVGELHAKIAAAGIPIDGVALNRDGSVRIDLAADLPDKQRESAMQAARAIVDAYDQDIENAAKEEQKVELPTVEAISGAKSVDDLKALVLKLRAAIESKV